MKYSLLLIGTFALFVIGKLLFTPVMTHLEPKIDGILFQITERDSIIKSSTLFSLSLALVPILTTLSWRLGRITRSRSKIVSILLIIFFTALGAFARHQEVKIFFIKVVRPALLTNGKTDVVYPIDPVNFVYYIFGGLVAGCLFSLVLLRKRKING